METPMSDIEKSKNLKPPRATEVETKTQYIPSHPKGQGAKQSEEEALAELLKAAEQGSAEAQYNLGINYYKGQGVRLSYKEAVAWFHKAAEQGFVEAQCELGKMYMNSTGHCDDYEEYIKYITVAAEHEHIESQAHLGYCYQNGAYGVHQNDEEAIKWYKRAYLKGSTIAGLSLAEMCNKNPKLNEFIDLDSLVKEKHGEILQKETKKESCNIS